MKNKKKYSKKGNKNPKNETKITKKQVVRNGDFVCKTYKSFHSFIIFTICIPLILYKQTLQNKQKYLQNEPKLMILCMDTL